VNGRQAKSFELLYQWKMETEIAVPNNQNGNAKWSTKSTIVFCRKSDLSPHHWVINEMPDSLEINFGKQKLLKLQEAIISIPNGNGAFQYQTNIKRIF